MTDPSPPGDISAARHGPSARHTAFLELERAVIDCRVAEPDIGAAAPGAAARHRTAESQSPFTKPYCLATRYGAEVALRS